MKSQLLSTGWAIIWLFAGCSGLPGSERVSTREVEVRTRKIAEGIHSFHDRYGFYPFAFDPTRQYPNPQSLMPNIHSNPQKGLRSDTDLPPRGPDDAPQLSWRVHLLPFLGYQQLYDKFRLNEPWDSPHNVKLLEEMPEVYASPGGNAKDGMTRFQLPTSNDRKSNYLYKHWSYSMTASITDGAFNTYMLAYVTSESNVRWTEPVDIVVDPADPVGTVVKVPNEKVAMMRASSRQIDWVDSKTNKELFNALLTASGGEYIEQLVIDADPKLSQKNQVEKEARRSTDDILEKTMQIVREASRLKNCIADLEHNQGDFSWITGSESPNLSWRVYSLMYPTKGHSVEIDGVRRHYSDLYRRDEPWNSEHNRQYSELPKSLQLFSISDSQKTTLVLQRTTPDDPDEGVVSVPAKKQGLASAIGQRLYFKIVHVHPDKAVHWMQPDPCQYLAK